MSQKQLKAQRRANTPWQPLRPATIAPDPNRTPEATAILASHDAILRNDRYTVFVRRFPGPEGWGTGIHLSIKRNDRLPIHDWRDLQRIKTEVLGPEVEAVELYPAESRVVDTANQYHLWAFPDLAGGRWPLGWETGMRLDAGQTTGITWIDESSRKSVQRPFA